MSSCGVTGVAETGPVGIVYGMVCSMRRIHRLEAPGPLPLAPQSQYPMLSGFKNINFGDGDDGLQTAGPAGFQRSRFCGPSVSPA